MSAGAQAAPPPGVLDRLIVAGGASALTLALFLVLPMMQAIGEPPGADVVLRDADSGEIPPPPPMEEEPPPPEEPEEPPELEEEAPPLDLAQLELALAPSLGDGWSGSGELAAKLDGLLARQEELDELFSLGDLDQAPRALYQPGPMLDETVRRKAPGTAWVLFVVGRDGRVEEAKVQKASDAVFARPALAAVEQWRFEPGKRGGEPVRSRMRVEVTFPRGL